MINLNLNDLRRKKLYIIRYNDNQVFKTSNLNTLKRLKRALKIMQIKDYHLYTIDIRKEQNI